MFRCIKVGYGLSKRGMSWPKHRFIVLVYRKTENEAIFQLNSFLGQSLSNYLQINKISCQVYFIYVDKARIDYMLVITHIT